MKLKVQKKDDAMPSNKNSSEKVPFLQNKPLCETVLDLQLTDEEKKLLQQSLGMKPQKVQKEFNIVNMFLINFIYRM